MKSITIRIPDDLAELIVRESATKNQTQSEFIREILESNVGQISEKQSQQRNNRDVSISPVERKILALEYCNLLAAHGKLPEELFDADSFQHVVTALEYGYAGEYSAVLGTDTELTYEECKLTWDILDMFRVLHFSVRKLGPDGWTKIGVIDAEHVGTFQGFDYQLDTESRLAGYVGYLVDTGRWEEQKEFIERNGGNSHHEMLPTYRAMLATFNPIWRKAASRGGDPNLSKEQIKQVLLAAPGSQVKH